MVKKLFSLLLIAFLSNANLFANSNILTLQTWRIKGPFLSEGDNSFYLDFLNKIGGERFITQAKINSSWGSIKADSTGYVNLSAYKRTVESKQIFYLYYNLEAKRDGNLALAVGYAGGLQIWINGKNVYSNVISRKPEADDDVIAIKVHKGSNNILVKVECGENYGFYFRVYKPNGNIFLNEARTICPDFMIGRRVNGCGQIQVLNIGTKKISIINADVLGDSILIPSSQSAYNIYPGETRLIPFLIAAKGIIPDKREISFVLKITANGIEKSIVIKPHLRKEGEYFVTTYRSKLDGSVQPYSVLLPKFFDPSKKYPLIMLLHGAWVTSWGQNIISYDSKDWAIQIAVHDRGNNRYREVGEVDLNEVMEEVKKHYKIDEDEIYLAGHSMGGYGTYFQAVRHPDKWNAISPQAGYTDYFLYSNRDTMLSFKKMNMFKKKLFEEWSPLLFAENLLHVPAYVVHGAKDDNVPVEHDREMSARLRALNYNFIYDENPDEGHWWGPRGKNYGIEVVDKPAIWNFLRKYKKRERKPSKVVYKTNSLRYNKAYWVTIDEMDSVYSMAEIVAEVKGNNKIDVSTNNITQFTLNLADSIVNIGEPLKISINSKLVFNDFLPSTECITLRKIKNNNFEIKNKYLVGELNQNGKIEKFSVIKNESLRKNHEIFGPVIDAFNTPFLFVTGKSKVSKKLSEAINFCANSLAKAWEISSQGSVKIKNDEEVTSNDILNDNLILFGNVTSNKIISKINKLLPIRFDNKKIEAEGKQFYSEGTGFIEVYPNPLNPQKYVIIIGGIDAQSFINASHISLEKIPDYVVYNSNSFKSNNVEYVLSGFFDKNWKLIK